MLRVTVGNRAHGDGGTYASATNLKDLGLTVECTVGACSSATNLKDLGLTGRPRTDQQTRPKVAADRSQVATDRRKR